MLGTIDRLRVERGFGFIRPAKDNGRGDHFFHCTAFTGAPFDERLIGMQVVFDSESCEKGLQAVNVRPAGASA